MRGPGRLHRSPDMAMANYFVQLQVGNFEEALCCTIGIVFQPLGAQDRVFECDSDGRASAAHRIAD